MTTMTKTEEKILGYVRAGAAVAMLLLAIYVVLRPGVAYDPTSRTVLFFLVALLPAILFAATTTATLELKLPGFVLTTAGALAVVLGTLYALDNLSEPGFQIAMYDVLNEKQAPIILDRPGTLSIRPKSGPLNVTTFVQGNSFVIIYPEQVPEVSVYVEPVPGVIYSGELTYAGTQRTALILDQDLISSTPSPRPE